MLILILTLSWRRPLSYRNQAIDLLRKLWDWFLYDNGLRHERVKVNIKSTWKRGEICLSLTMKTAERNKLRHSIVFIINFEHISHLF